MRGAARSIIPTAGDGERRRPHRVGYPKRQLQRRPTLLARDHDLALAPDRVHEALQLQRQRIGLGSLEHDPLHHVRELAPGARLPVAAQPHELAAAGREVEREVAVGLEEPQPAHPLPRDARGGGQRHRPIGELDPGVREVEVGGEHREPRGAHFGGFGAAGEMEHQIEIVDHEIEHDGDVGAPGLEGRQPEALDVPGAVQVGLRRADGPVVALDVPDLELHPCRGRLRRSADPPPPA